jgi:lantibiotic transport system permease protein
MENNFENKMNNLQTPDSGKLKHQEVLKMAMINARKSSKIGLLILLIPALFILIAYIKIQILMRIDLNASLNSLIEKANQIGYLKWFVPAIFVGLPILATIINLLAITHFYVDKTNKELIISVKYRLKNIIIILISFVIFISFIWFMLITIVHFR